MNKYIKEMWKIGSFVFTNALVLHVLFSGLNSTDPVEFYGTILGFPTVITLDYYIYNILWGKKDEKNIDN